jgi:elongation factor Ts
MSEITATLVKELRERTGVGMMECKKALSEVGGDLDKAVEHLRKLGASAAAKKAGRETSEGLVESYIHPGGRVGVLVEVNCETDFVARTDEFQELARGIAMHIAAEQPRWVQSEDIPEDVQAAEKEVYRAMALNEGRPEKVLDKIVDGRMAKYCQETCLLEQPYVRDDQKTVGELVKEARAKLGENIVIRRFVRFQLGEEL